MYENDLKRIIDASQNNALSFFVGAGVSRLSGAPTWKELIWAICEKMGWEQKDKYSSDEYLQIPQMYYYSLGDNTEEYYGFVEEKLNCQSLSPNTIHREMLKLNPTSFITTNYDTLLEDAATQYCQSFKVVSCDEDVPSIFGDRFILKLHGDFTHRNIVLKEEDYLNYSDNFKLIETLVKSIFATNTVVFIGYGLNDYNVKLILNWAKSLLKTKFREPIFIYTDTASLKDEEIKYHESKGLSVVEWSKLISSTDDYQSRYLSVFDALKSFSGVSLDGKTEDEAFEILHNILKPLDRLDALRPEDISKALAPNEVIVGEEGAIYYLKDDHILLSKFLLIHQLPETERFSLPKNTIDKYSTILRVFKKARVNRIHDNEDQIFYTIDEAPLADRNCILFNYSFMDAFSTKEHKSLKSNYKKAYYLSRLKRYDEAFFLFSRIAKQAFKEGDYLLYYLSEANCISLHKVIENVDKWHHCYDLPAIEALSPSDLEAEDLFRRLPVEFRKLYDSLRDIHSVNMLYQYSYKAQLDGQKLIKNIESNAVEFGLTSSGKAICKINNYLHFLQGNCIIADVFSEYKNTVKHLLSLLVYKYSTQDKKIIHERLFPFESGNGILFDEIDFYCFIDCFDADEIETLFRKYHVETISFHNMELIESSVSNIMAYYEQAIKVSKNNIDVIDLQKQIKNCIVLLRYVDISQGLVEKICSFILNHEFREILINDKVKFLNYQLAHRKKASAATTRTVENALIHYIDKHISSLENKEPFNLFSSSSSVNYFSLAHYLSPSYEPYSSRRLSMRITHILNNRLIQLYPHIVQHYYNYVSEYQKKKLVSWAKKELSSSFKFDFLTMLIQCNARITSKIKNQLKEFLKLKVDMSRVKACNQDFDVYPNNNTFEELEQVGYWCLINVLNKKDFKEFIGYSAKFDFYCEYRSFDFKRFDVAWLLNLYPHTLKQIAADEKVKSSVRSAIASKLITDSVVASDRERLQEILVKYFC